MGNRAQIRMLAGYLDKSVKVAAINRSVTQILADGSDAPSGLKVLRHGEGAEFAYNMYKEYVSDNNFQYFPDFMQKLDNMLFEFRGNQPLEVADDDDEDEEEAPRRSSLAGKRRKKKSRYKPIKRAKATEPLPAPSREESEPEDDSSVVVSSTLARIQEKARKRAGIR